AETIAVNTDAQQLLYTDADRKLLIGKEITGGLGAGGDPEIGLEAAKESRDIIKKHLQDSDMVFITCGLGGGTGTGAAPIVAEISKSLGALTVCVVTLPFDVEGENRKENANIGLDKLREKVDTIIVIPNSKILEVMPSAPMSVAFKSVDNILVDAVKGLTELITKPGLVNLDFADVRAVMRNGGIAMIGLGQSNSGDRATECVVRALNNPFLPLDIKNATGALVNVIGGPDVTIKEAQEIVETVTETMDDEARIIWGARIIPSLKTTIRTMLIITGIKQSDLFEAKELRDWEKEELEQILGIDIVSD
ncbi:MAG: cell division protein FtsZ, partial [Candidatus Heimdallarchaeaceae archaeon]